MSHELKIKFLSLSAESRIIRKYEKKLFKKKKIESGNSLHLHRINDVRKETRATHLVLSYLRGTPYTSVEQPPKSSNKMIKEVPMKRCDKLLAKYAPEHRAGFQLWVLGEQT